jgi:hypothetical protein
MAVSAGAHRDGSGNGQGNHTCMTIGDTMERDPDGSTRNSIVPTWDHDRRELRWNGRLVKVFKLPSPNQERIIAAFAEENWPARIDDPLPPDLEITPRQRLRDAIRNLNRNQRARLIRFMGDGSGEGIRWESAGTLGEFE